MWTCPVVRGLPHHATMSRSHLDRASGLKAVLGPTNTGKTHLAIERMCGHSSGMIGFPLRLLAREVYDKVCAIKGAAQVALITGEERIEPPGARYLLCTVEAMPMDADLAFVALDEAQLAAEQPRQLPADRQAQAGAAVLAAGAAVGLLERLEDDLLLVGRDADAGI